MGGCNGPPVAGAWTALSGIASPFPGHLLVLLKHITLDPLRLPGNSPIRSCCAPVQLCDLFFHPSTLSFTRVRFESVGATLLNTSSLRSTIAPVARNGTPLISNCRGRRSWLFFVPRDVESRTGIFFIHTLSSLDEDFVLSFVSSPDLRPGCWMVDRLAQPSHSALIFHTSRFLSENAFCSFFVTCLLTSCVFQ